MVTLGDAIDFKCLYAEEKKKARERRRQNEQGIDHASEVIAATTESSRLGDVKHPVFQGPLSLPSHLTLDREVDVVSKFNPSSIFYKELFLPGDFGERLWMWLEEVPTTNDIQQQHNGFWHYLTHARRWVAVFENTTQAFPAPLKVLVETLVRAGIFDRNLEPNHILVNRYTPSQGILPHTDGPAYLNRTATISIGKGQVVLRFTPRQEGDFPEQQLILHGGGSLVVFEGDAYIKCMHSIRETNDSTEITDGTCLNAPAGTIANREDRISLTIRHRLRRQTLKK